jgi:hypothetical protein
MGIFFRKGILFWLLVPALIIFAWMLYNRLDLTAENKEGDSYAGSVQCIDCHEKFYQLWAPSHHGLAMQTITPGF